MKSFAEAIRNFLFGHRIMKALTIGFGLFAIYMAANYVLLSDGFSDPVYLLTGVPRRQQVIAASSIFALGMFFRLLWIPRSFEFVSGAGRRKGMLLLAALIFLNSLSASLTSVLTDVSSVYWLTLYGWAALILAIQTGILAAALTYVRNAWAHLALLSGLATLNVLALYLTLSPSYWRTFDLMRGFSVFCLFLGFVLLFALVGRKLIPLAKLNGVLAIAMLAPAVSLFWQGEPLSSKSGPLTQFDRVKFKSRPDIHIVAIDALSPFRLTEKYLDLRDLPLERLIVENRGTIFRNAFVSHAPTKRSLNSIMRLAHGGFDKVMTYFAGQKEGPVTRVLRNNGYKIATGFDVQYFGKKGPFVDLYNSGPESITNSTFCTLAFGSAFKFFSVCDLPWPAPKQIDWPEFVLGVIKRSAEEADRRPIFSLHYIISVISHTPLDYRTDDQTARALYRERYRNGVAKLTGIVERAIRIARNSARPTILLLVGDHGPYLSRSIEFEQAPRFFVEDRFGVLVAILVNDSHCGPDALKRYSATYTTPERLLAGLMACLSDDPKYMDGLMKFKESYAFKDFLYE